MLFDRIDCASHRPDAAGLLQPQACDKPDEHAAQQKVSNHGRVSLSVAREAEQVAAVMHELVHIHALHDRRGAFFGPDEIDGEQ